MNHFCTYCDQGYLGRLLCLHDSLAEKNEAFRLYVACFDAKTAEVVIAKGMSSLVAIPLEDLRHAEPDYAAIKSRRTAIEYFFTTTPVLLRHCLERFPAIDRITYLDSDLYFFGPSSAVFSEQGDASVGLVPHRFPNRLRERLLYGTYNVGWVSFRRDHNGIACLDWWRERCLEWCHDYPDQGRFADQGYLDEFPRRFGDVCALEHPGINAGPWNIDGLDVAKAGERVLVGGRPLLFYHFQGIREVRPGWFEPGLKSYKTRLTREQKELIYLPYLRRLTAMEEYLQAAHRVTTGFRHQRLHAGTSMRDRWERLKSRWLLPYLGRARGQLVRCHPSARRNNTDDLALVP